MKKSLRFAAIVSGLVAVMSLLSVTPAVAQALGAQGATLADEVVAVVNDGVITGRELDQRVSLISRRLQQQNSPVPPMDELRSQVLNQMVVERIQLQKAKEDGITVTDATVQSTLQRLAAANNMTLDQYQAQLEKLGVPWSTFVGDARNELLLSRLREKEVDSKITVTDSEVAAYIASQRGPNAGSQQDVRLEHIFVAAPQNAPEAQIDTAQKKADALLKQALASGTNFEKLAKSDSEAKDAKTGGDLGFKSQSALPADVVQAVAQLRPGQVNPALIRVPDGFEIVRLVDRRPAAGTAGASPKIVQTHVRHILLRVGDGKSEAQARQQLIDIRNQVAAGGDFANFARTYSQDGSASQGGDLGWISPGETVPEFERAMNQLQDGQVSQPVRSEYGYHLIQVLGRRDAEGSVQKQMDIARQAIGQRKAEQAYADWLRELRDSSYVQIKNAPLAN
ncbi:peptidylprolyl isomerase [Burkholderia sp. 22PA0099]|uniref:peptidylprolyl isomerase n=1 Tax=Burkholderia sp. 22PA0099 TaxID=3237372 RepID=UPI0039C3A999